MDEDWATWWRGDRLRPHHKHVVASRDVEIANDIHNWLYHDGALTQAKFAEALLGFNNAITNLFSELLAPKGHEDWKLTLKQSRRGAPRKGDPLELIAHFYDQFVEEHGERGAVKRFAKKVWDDSCSGEIGPSSGGGDPRQAAPTLVRRSHNWGRSTPPKAAA
jgi:hypothetical protein